jgi:serine/threonine protein kinase
MFPRDPLPDQIGAYKIVRHLSSLGGADLYLARHRGPLGFERSCVLKLVPSPAGGDPSAAAELAREAGICARLDHPAIVRIYDFFEHGDHIALVFEHFTGVSLARLLSHLRRRRIDMPDPVVWYVAHRIFGALAHAHALTDEQGQRTPVIHRDVQPAHVVIGSDGQVRLSGFGIAKIAGTTGDTAVGFVKGTPAYMAPEQARGDKVTERVDVYAAGLVVWEMLCGKSAAPRADVPAGAELLKLISGRRVETVSSLRKDVPREIAAAIDACLEPSADKRTIRCADVEKWLTKVVDVASGCMELKERVVQLRNVSIRPPPAAAPTVRTSLAPKPAREPTRAPARFPGFATRLTGRVSAGAQTHAPPSSRVPAVLARAPDSQRAPRLDAPAPASPQPVPQVSAEGAPASVIPRPLASKRKMQTMLGVAPPATARSPSAPAPAPAPPPDRSTQDGGRREGILPSDPRSAEIASPPAPQPSPQTVAAAEQTEPANPFFGDAGPESAFEPVAAAAKPASAPSDAPAVRAGPLAERPRVPAVAVEQLTEADIEPGEPTMISVRRRTFRRRMMLALAALAVCAGASGLYAVWSSARRRAAPWPPVAAPSTAATSATAPREILSVPASAGGAASWELPAQAAAPAPSSAVSAAAVVSSGQAQAPAPPLEVPPGMASLVVESPPKGAVFVNGVALGETDRAFVAPCGRRYVRVGTAPGPKGLAGVSWLSPGQSVKLECGKGHVVRGMPEAPLPDGPGKNTRNGPPPRGDAPF